MNRPYIIYHMLTSLDCKIEGSFLQSPHVLRCMSIITASTAATRQMRFSAAG